MTERYDDDAARHYAAYRPALHEPILKRALGGRSDFAIGVDVGCGTGLSALALATRCQQVFGIDPSDAMLAQAEPHERITYLHGTGEAIPLPDQKADIVTFAGSLFYTDSAATRAEVLRIARQEALVLVYDFEMLLEPILHGLSLEGTLPVTDYDHAINFSGNDGFIEESVIQEKLVVEMSPFEFAHVVLSDSNRLDHFARELGSVSAFDALVAALDAATGNHPVPVETDVYHALYRLSE